MDLGALRLAAVEGWRRARGARAPSGTQRYLSSLLPFSFARVAAAHLEYPSDTVRCAGGCPQTRAPQIVVEGGTFVFSAALFGVLVLEASEQVNLGVMLPPH